MKKSLLLAAAAIFVLSASAQMRVQQRPAPLNKQAVVNTHFQNVLIQDAQQFTGTSQASISGPLKTRPSDAPKYRRPAGTFYACILPNFNWFGTIALMGKPYGNWEFKNMSEVPATDWTYWLYNSTTKEEDEYQFSGQDFSYPYGYTAVTCPTLTAGDLSYSATQSTDEAEGGGYETVNGELWSIVNTTDLTGTSYPNLLATPHFIFGTRYEQGDDTGYYWTAYKGALDADGGTNGLWFGKNYSGWNGFALAVEKPAQPYVLNKVYGYAYGISIKGNVDLTCRVYRMPDMPQYCDEGAEVDPEVFNEDNLIATGTYTLTPKALGEGSSMMMDFNLEQYDPELDMSYQVTPEIDCPIIIVMSGYDSDNVNSFTFAISLEDEDEGWGENTYMLRQEDGVVTGCYGLDMFFALSQTEGMPLKVSPTIFMDISTPFLVYNFDEEDEPGEYTFPAEGGEYLTLGQYPGVYFFGVDQYSADVNAESIFYCLEDGNDVPDWLTITMEDEEYQTQSGETGSVPKALVTCAALPDGVQGREAKVKFYINGANLVYDFKQGDVVEPQPAKVYLIGDDPLGGWNPEAPIEMTENEETEGLFTYTVNVEEAKDIYFVFTEGIGSWAEVNGHRYGPTEANQDVVVGEDMTTQLSTNDQAAYKLAAVAGEYTITFNKNNMTFRVDGGVAPEPDYVLHYGHEGVEWQDATFVPGEGENEGKLVVADLALDANTEFGVKYGETWFAGLPNEGEDNYVIHYGWCTDIPLSTGDNVKNFLINEAGTYTFLLTVGDEGNTLTVNGFTAPALPGDANGDGQVDISDVNSVINQMLGKEPMIPACDMNGDGKIDISDVNAVINKMLGK